MHIIEIEDSPPKPAKTEKREQKVKSVLPEQLRDTMSAKGEENYNKMISNLFGPSRRV